MVSASIVTYNHHLLDFEPVLRSLFASPVQIVYVVDHSDSMLDLKAELQEFAERVLKGEPELRQKAEQGFQLIYLPHENNGYGGGHNVALNAAIERGSKYHLVVNPDVWFGPEVIPSLISYMDAHENVGQMMPKVMYPNGQIQRLARLLPTPFDIFGRFCLPEFLIRRRNKTCELVQSGFTKTLNVAFLSGCFMFLRMSAVKEIGLFDERFFLYAEDIDFTRRMNENYLTLFYPKTTIYHTFTRGSHKSLKLLLIHVFSIIKYFNKWGWWRDKGRREVNNRLKREIGGAITMLLLMLTLFLPGLASPAMAATPYAPSETDESSNAVGSWQWHLSYTDIDKVSPAGNMIYVTSNGNLFSYNKNDRSVRTYTKFNGLTSTDITHIAWVNSAKKLLIVYKDYTIDLLSSDDNVEALFGLKNHSTTKSKTVVGISVNGQYAYVETELGILKINAKEAVIEETLDPDAAIPADTQEQMTVEEYEALSGSARPDGPAYPQHYFTKLHNGVLYTLRGRYDYNDVSTKNPGNVQKYDGTDWSVLDTTLLSGVGRNYINNIHMDVDPRNSQHLMVASQTGLYEYLNGALVKYYDSPAGGAVMSVAYDSKGNLWVFYRGSNKLYCLTAGGTWEEHNVSSIGSIDRYVTPFIDSRGLLWFINNHHNPLACGFYNPSSDTWSVLTTFINEDGTNLRNTYTHGKVVAEDKDGNVWIGTSGFLVYLTPSDISAMMSSGGDNSGIRVTQHKVSRNDGSGYADYLLNGLNINDIKFDSANRKWVATEGNGVYLISSDNNTEVEHFTTSNSDIISDVIKSIAIDETNGRVIFGAMNGLCVYQSDVTSTYGSLNKNDVYAYPNPVTPDYTGPVTITGLTENCQIKITNTSGYVVHSGTSVGGSYKWNGCDQKGERVASGVYMVLVATDNGEKGCVAKIAMIK